MLIWDDTNPAYMGEFYKNLRILSQDLYRKSSNSDYPLHQSFVRENSLTFLGRESSMRSRDNPAKLSKQISKRSLSNDLQVSADTQKQLTSTGDSQNVVDGIPFSLNRSGSLRVTTDISSPSVNKKSIDSSISGEKASSISDRVLNYAKESGLPAEYLDRYSQILTSRHGESIPYRENDKYHDSDVI